MSVFTPVTPEQLALWLERYRLGTLIAMQGIATGIENTNYFVTTSSGKYVLTLFEKLTPTELPFYLGLMSHLSQHGIPSPAPAADAQGGLFSQLNGKPAALLTRLEGAAITAPTSAHCSRLGAILADIHLVGQTYPATLENPRGLRWWHLAAPQVEPFLDAQRAAMLRAEIAFQSLQDYAGLPRGPIHADLFRDNVLFDGEEVGGVIDFYFAGVDSLLFDVAVTLNDWCVLAKGEFDRARTAAFLAAYHAKRPFTAAEHHAWPAMLRAAALRFWLSRLYDFYLPRPGELVHAHDPEHFRRILELRIAQEADAPWI